jgi:hypothetical protein
LAAAAVLGGGLAVGVVGTVLTSETATAPTTSSTAATTSTSTTLPPTTTTLPADRPIGPVAYAPLAMAGDLTILHPTGRVERVGFHESSLDGAMELEPLPTAVAPSTLNTRDRGHGPRTAVDVVSDPSDLVRAPASGTVVEAGGYQLYCRVHDDTVVIVPDGHPTWRVRVLHIDGVRVVPGWRVEAGITVIAARPRVLPFGSQIDRLTAAASAWPHVHVEVDDDTIPDSASDGDSCVEAPPG